VHRRTGGGYGAQGVPPHPCHASVHAAEVNHRAIGTDCTFKEAAMTLYSESSATQVNVTGRATKRRLVVLLLGILLNAKFVCGQQAEAAVTSDQPTMQVLLQKIEQLEADDKLLKERVAQLEKSQVALTLSPAPAQPTRVPTSSAAHGDDPSEVTEPEKMDVSKTLLNIRGFGDFGLYGSNQKGNTTSFGIGELNLFITSNLSDKFKFLTELVFEVHQNNEFEEDLERVLLEYSFNDYLKLSAGRYHTAIGYYNTAYHHTTWFETATERPFLFQFEDEGGILPVHNVGVSASGQIPSGSIGLHYVAEVGNGRASSSSQVQPVQNIVDENNHKSVNLAIFARPDKIPGLQVGFSAYRDVLAPLSARKVDETILDAYAVLVRQHFEWLNEAVMIRHAPMGGSHVFDTPGFYTQISKAFGPYRPYFRYQYVNASNNEPIFPTVGLRTGPTVGIRYNASESVALKLQYEYTEQRQQQSFNALAMQVGFTF
jgi:hypothetical protein